MQNQEKLNITLAWLEYISEPQSIRDAVPFCRYIKEEYNIDVSEAQIEELKSQKLYYHERRSK
jgi:hypothetical protein